MTGLTKDQRFAPSCGHDLDPPGFVSAIIRVQIFERVDMMHLDFVGHMGCPTDFTYLGEESFFQFRASIPGHLMRCVLDGCLAIPC